ncbi:hypothetical protein [Frigidibacter sp. ROC022]|uniref:hypothetical protein n=1 Tax=Frigidibacter sp. ROC022 TaxID=2971796 RepID=UPI00215B432F|nr:hypothetical protein [Frigidibacter sp. ROC022]MCR8723489.1 hypothetical protein [Frigidibacter sp. ROC022]
MDAAVEAETVLDRLQTTDGGTHVFGLPQPLQTTAGLILDLEFEGLHAPWTLSFPLADSPFGFQANLTAGSLNAFLRGGP